MLVKIQFYHPAVLYRDYSSLTMVLGLGVQDTMRSPEVTQVIRFFFKAVLKIDKISKVNKKAHF